MTLFFAFVLILTAYLLGAVPFSIWFGRFLYQIDIRDYGSGNAGATNAGRVLGKKVGILVFFLDALKGFFAVNILWLSGFYVPGTESYVNFQILLGIAAVIGHFFPVYVGFKGGKGVATLFGVIIAIAPLPTAMVAGVFVLTLLTTKYVSLSSLACGLAFPLVLLFVFKINNINLILFSIAVFVLLLVTHQKNIERLVRREENKVGFLCKKK